MKIITTLNPASVTEGEVREPRGILQVLHVEPRPGCQIKLQLGSAGLFIRRGDLVVCVPTDALLSAAVSVLPELVSPAAVPNAVKQEAQRLAQAAEGN